MKTSEFISALEQHPELPLFFEYKSGAYTRNDYHITEIKNVKFDTVDCGGILNKWQEVHVQLWENKTPEPEHNITTNKALKIFNVVEKVRPVFKNVEIKIEYGNEHFHTAVLPVQDITVETERMIVRLTEEQTTCKAKDRAVTDEEKADACCSTPTQQEKRKLKLSELNTEYCKPNSGCC